MQTNSHEKSCSSRAADIFEKKEPLWKQMKVLVLLVFHAALAAGLYLEFVALE